MTSTAPVFAVSALEYRVGDRRLLHNIDIAFAAGEISALIGHNGSGKSTLLKLLARQIAATSGSIHFAGTPASTLASREFARKVAYLPQSFAAAPDMSVRELVACGRYPWHGALGRFTEADRVKVEDALRATHIEALADRMVDTLSGGERQRAWIAMLIAQDSTCLLLDEPTSALDLGHQLEVLSLVRRLSREKKLSVIAVLHDINMAARFVDHIFALKGGELIASGTPDDIMNGETLARIYGIPMDVIANPRLGSPLAYAC